MTMETDDTITIELKPDVEAALHALDAEVSDLEVISAAKEILLMQKTLLRREETIAKIPGFWGVVFAHAAPEFVGTFTPQDAAVLADCLVGLRVLRPEIPASATPATEGPLSAFGEPRSFTLVFRFSENEWLADQEISKTFWHRYDADGDPALVSEPVKISWKPGKDLTEGLNEAAYNLWVAQGKAGHLDANPGKDRQARKKLEAAARALPEYQALAKLLKQKRSEDSEGDKQTGSATFFNLFAYRGEWVSKGEDQASRAERDARRAAWSAGKIPDEDDDEEEDDEDDNFDDTVELAVEPSPMGYDVAETIAENLWPRAIHYFFNDDDAAYLDELDDDSDDDEDDEDTKMEE